MVGNLVDEIAREMLNPRRAELTKTYREMNPDETGRLTELIRKIKAHIAYLAGKYDLQSSEFHLDRMIESRKASMWVILCDTTSSKLKGYGEFPDEYSGEFDADMGKLQELILKL